MDASNRIVAAILCAALERCAASRISYMQRGVIPGRHMMSNLIDIDEAAQKTSVHSTRGAVVLLDFKAAFPSVDHGFMWETLEAAGIPTNRLPKQCKGVEDKRVHEDEEGPPNTW